MVFEHVLCLVSESQTLPNQRSFWTCFSVCSLLLNKKLAWRGSMHQRPTVIAWSLANRVTQQAVISPSVFAPRVCRVRTSQHSSCDTTTNSPGRLRERWRWQASVHFSAQGLFEGAGGLLLTCSGPNKTNCRKHNRWEGLHSEDICLLSRSQLLMMTTLVCQTQGHTWCFILLGDVSETNQFLNLKKGIVINPVYQYIHLYQGFFFGSPLHHRWNHSKAVIPGTTTLHPNSYHSSSYPVLGWKFSPNLLRLKVKSVMPLVGSLWVQHIWITIRSLIMPDCSVSHIWVILFSNGTHF